MNNNQQSSRSLKNNQHPDDENHPKSQSAHGEARASEEGVVAMRGPGGQMMLSAEGPRATAEAGRIGSLEMALITMEYGHYPSLSLLKWSFRGYTPFSDKLIVVGLDFMGVLGAESRNGTEMVIGPPLSEQPDPPGFVLSCV